MRGLDLYTKPCIDLLRKMGGNTDWDRARIRALRQHMGLTQDRFARHLGVRQQTVSEWETGVYEPRGTSVTLLRMVAEKNRFSYGAPPDRHE